MVLKEGRIVQDGHSFCTGCGAVVFMNQGYLMLELDESDQSVIDTDLVYAYFHTQHCVSLMIANAESYIKEEMRT